MRVTPLIGNKILLAPNDDDRDQVKAFERLIDIMEAEENTLAGMITRSTAPEPMLIIGPRAALERVLALLRPSMSI